LAKKNGGIRNCEYFWNFSLPIFGYKTRAVEIANIFGTAHFCNFFVPCVWLKNGRINIFATFFDPFWNFVRRVDDGFTLWIKN
jgi:hypothetical protein